MGADDCLSRRRLLAQATAAAATSFEVPRILHAAKLVSNQDPYGGWPVGVQSYSLRNFNTLEAIRHIEGMGLHYVEFYGKHLPLDASEQQLAETKQLLDAARITISAHGVNNFTRDHEANRRVFEFARRAGIRNLTANPQPDSFDSLEKLVDQYKVRICIHNHGPGALYDKIEDVQRAVKDRHPRIGVCVDTGHFIRSGEDPVEAIRALGSRVFAVHLKDDKFRRDKRSHNVVIGQANLDVPGIFQALGAVEFPTNGALSLEYEANPANPIDDMKQCLTVAREAIAEADASPG